MILEVWRGWTTPENGPAYEKLLRETVFPGIAAKNVAGYRNIRLLRREVLSRFDERSAHYEVLEEHSY